MFFGAMNLVTTIKTCTKRAYFDDNLKKIVFLNNVILCGCIENIVETFFVHKMVADFRHVK